MRGLGSAFPSLPSAVALGDRAADREVVSAARPVLRLPSTPAAGEGTSLGGQRFGGCDGDVGNSAHRPHGKGAGEHALSREMPVLNSWSAFVPCGDRPRNPVGKKTVCDYILNEYFVMHN